MSLFARLVTHVAVAASLLGVPYSSLVILPGGDEVTDFAASAGPDRMVNPNWSFEEASDAVMPLARRVVQEPDNEAAALESALELMNLYYQAKEALKQVPEPVMEEF